MMRILGEDIRMADFTVAFYNERQYSHQAAYGDRQGWPGCEWTYGQEGVDLDRSTYSRSLRCHFPGRHPRRWS
jgi:hypothetical protein